VVGPHDEIQSRKDELVDLLTSHRQTWERAD